MGLVELPGDQLDCKSRRKVDGLVILGSWRIERVTLKNENWQLLHRTWGRIPSTSGQGLGR